MMSTALPVASCQKSIASHSSGVHMHFVVFLSLRIAIINATYSKQEAREKVLDAIAWSFNALSVVAGNHHWCFCLKSQDA